MEQLAHTGRVFSDPDPAQAIADALAHTKFEGEEPIVSWADIKRACAVDVDFHGATKPNPDALKRVVERLPIQPAHAWISHGQGLKLVYFATDLLTAEQQGEIVKFLLEKTLTYSAGWHLTGIELKTDFRHPAYSRGVDRCARLDLHGATDLEAARRKLFYEYPDDELDPERWEEWLKEEGYRIGQRLAHEHCPIKPGPKDSDCVVVLDGGFYCHSCAGHSLSYPGVSKPGWVPARLMMDGSPIRPSSLIRDVIRNYVHREQAQYIIPRPELHRALLTLHHMPNADEPEFVERQINKVFMTYDLIRLNGMWYHRHGERAGETGRREVLSCLPCTHYFKGRNSKGDIVTGQDKLKLGRLQSLGSNLSDLGVASMVPLRGLDMAERVRLMRPVPDDRVLAVLPANPPINLRRVVTADELAEARAVVEGRFRGICWNYLLLGIAAKGCVQQSLGVDTPRILAMGPTAAGKTQTAKLANILTGEPPNVYKFREDEERVKRSYFDGSMAGSIVIFDEFEKIAKRLPEGQLLEYMLLFETGVKAHLLHKGEFIVEMPAAVVLTCIDPPDAVFAQAEIGRRWVLVDVGAGSDKPVDWVSSSLSNGVEYWLTQGYHIEEHRKARDTIVSWVVKKYFDGDKEWTFLEIAADLGFKTLDKSGESQDERYAELYRLVESLPVWPTGRLAGYHIINMAGDDPAVNLFPRSPTAGRIRTD